MLVFGTVFLFQKVLWESRLKTKRGNCMPLWSRLRRRLSMTRVCLWSWIFIAMLLIVTTLLCFSSLSLFCFWYLEEQCFLGGFSVKFIVDFGCEISWVGCVLQRDSVGFFGLFKGVSWGFLWLVFAVVFLFQKVLWEFFLVDFLWRLAKNFVSCVLFAMMF